MATLDAMALIVERKNPGMRCSILLVDEEREYITCGAGPSLPPAYNKAIEGLRIGPKVGSCGTAAFWNVPVIVEDIYRDPLWCDLLSAADIAGVSACWSHPVTAANGDVLGAMALYATRPCVPSRSQMDGLEIAARMVGLAVERDRLEEQLLQAAKMEAIGILAGGVAHDFNNILATVLGNAELALVSVEESCVATPMLQEIVTATNNASELCSQLLAYAGKGAPRTETVEVNSLTKELGGLLQVTLPKKARLDYELHTTPLAIEADRSQIRQVLMNMITNAGEAIGDQEGHIVIGTQACTLTRAGLDERFPNSNLEPGDYLRLWVSDTGVGMDSKTQARVFDPFFSTRAPGRGLGLAATRGIVRAHKGAIKLESTRNVGTIFTIVLPCVPVPKDGSASPVQSTSTRPKGGRILLADDEPQVLGVIAMILEGAGYQVLMTQDGFEALSAFRRDPDSIDCVLLDLSMPRMGGEEVTAKMREIRDNIPIVLMSGFAGQDLLTNVGGNQSTSFLQKPVKMQDLLAVVESALKQRLHSRV